MGLLSTLASKTPKPPKAAIPAAPASDAKAETGADVILGGEKDTASSVPKSGKRKTTKTTAGSGLSVGTGKTGINIL